MTPARIILIGFALLILAGALLLTLPISTRDGQGASFFDALFTATSATCVTGLVVQDTSLYWSGFGQAVIILLIQIGGMGVVTVAVAISMLAGRRIGLKERWVMQESISAPQVGGIVRMTGFILKGIFLIEGMGAVILAVRFCPEMGFTTGIWYAMFHSVSAFCNAGFDNLGFLGEYTSLTTFNDNYLVIFTIMALIVIGGLGFVVWNDLMAYRKTRVLLLHTKIVLMVTIFLILFGALGYLGLEWDNEKTMQALDMKGKIGAAFMQSITMRTAGFNSIDLYSMTDAAKVFSVVLMFIGAAPGSTGGGIKVTTTAVIIMTAVSIIRGREEPYMLKRRIAASVVYRSLAIMFLGVVVVGATTMILMATSPLGQNALTGLDATFEAVSGFATVGVSSGVTAVSTPISKIALILSMFIGRVGPVSFGLSLAGKSTSRKVILPEGKIIVG